MTHYKSPSEVLKFTNANIVTYFVMRKVCDGSSCTDFKAINQSAIDLQGRSQDFQNGGSKFNRCPSNIQLATFDSALSALDYSHYTVKVLATSAL